MKIKYLLIGLCLVSTNYILSFKPTRYTHLLRDRLETLELRKKRLNDKVAAYNKPVQYPVAGFFGISKEQEETIQASREELIKQLGERQTLLIQRIKAVKARQRDLLKSPPKNTEEEARAIKQESTQHKIADLQEKIADIALTQSLLEKQHNGGNNSGLEIPKEQASPGFIQQWAVQRATLEEQLKDLQAEVGPA